MERIELFKRRKQLSIFIGIVGFFLILLFLWGRITGSETGVNFPLMGLIFVIQLFLNFRSFKKYHFQFDKQHIQWSFPGMTEQKTIRLSENQIEISTNWKGIQLNNEDQSFIISTDGLWNREKKLIYSSLKEYYS